MDMVGLTGGFGPKRSGRSGLFAVEGRYLDDLQKVADLRYDIHEALVFDRFGDVIAAAQRIELVDLMGVVRRRQHDDRNFLQLVVGLEAPKHFDTVYSGHADIQQQDIGLVWVAVRQGAAPEQEIQRSLAVLEYLDVVDEFGPFEIASDEGGVARIVFGQ